MLPPPEFDATIADVVIAVGDTITGVCVASTFGVFVTAIAVAVTVSVY